MNQTAIHIPRNAPWLPPSLLKIPGEIRHTFQLSEPERRIFRKHKKIQVSKWAAMYRYVTMSVLPGKWKNEVTPHLAGIMDASFFPSVQTIILCKAPQVGGTEATYNCIGYAIDRDPGPVLLIYPDEQTARENNQDRIQPMIKASPRLRSYMTGAVDDTSMLRINLSHMPIYMAWARSAARLGNKPIRYMIFDEVDKYPDTAGKKESDPISLGESRTITYRHNRKIWKIGTTTIEAGNIWKALTTEAQVIFDYFVTCPFCHHHHKMNFGNIEWEHKKEADMAGVFHSEDPEVIEAEKLAWYKCPQCAAKWTDYDRDRAARMGIWRDRKGSLELFEYLRTHRPLKIGFHLPSWISPFVSFSEIAAAYLRGRHDINKYKDFYNKHRAEPWRLFLVSKDEAQILASRSPIQPQVVPEMAVALTCGVDVQKHGFWFVVRAWTAELTSWNIHYGFLERWEDVEKLFYETSYPVMRTKSPAGVEDKAKAVKTMRIFRAAVDTGGGKKFEDMSMTEETYYWLIKNRGRGGISVWGTKGASNPLPGMLSLGSAIMSSPSGKKLPGALRVLSVDTAKAKDQFHYRLSLSAKDDTRHLPGAAFLHSATGSDYAAQILAEQKQITDKNVEEWVNIHKRPNHLFDAEILAGACVEMEFPGGGLRLLSGAGRTVSRSGGRRVISKGIE
jgi:phage terminase large subunit GpA-like protein